MERLASLFAVEFSAVAVMFLLNFFADRLPSQYDPDLAELERPCPKVNKVFVNFSIFYQIFVIQISASYFSKLTFHWSTMLIWKGYRNPVEQKDLWHLHPKMTSRGVVPTFNKYYK